MDYTSRNWLTLSLMGITLCAPSFLSSTPPLLAKIHTDYSQNMKPATIKVLLNDKAEGAILEVSGQYDIFDPNTHLPIASSILQKKGAIYAEAEGIKWGDRFPGIHQMRIVPSNGETSILINGIEYRGCIEIYDLDGVISIVNEVDVESFLKSTLSIQLSAINHPVLLEALAIVARTHAYYLASRGFKAQWQVKAEEIDYLGYGVTLQHLEIERAIENTRPMILTYKSMPFAATWTENSAGRTASYASIFRKQIPAPNGIAVPIAAKEREKNHWTFSIDQQELATLAGLSKITAITPYLDRASEKTYAIHVTDGAFSQDIDFLTLQKKIGKEKLKSSDFEFEMKGDKIIFKGWGKGAGVGLCLYSGLKMANQGKSAAQILAHFFPGTQLQNTKSLGEKQTCTISP